MTIEESKNIKLTDYLHSLGYNPIKQQGNSLWYKSPLREEQEPSFKVNTDRNLWYDFGTGKGGNILALAQELYASRQFTLPFRPYSGAKPLYPSRFFFLSPAVINATEFPTFGNSTAFLSCLVCILAG